MRNSGLHIAESGDRLKVEKEIKSAADQLCKWSPDGALESKDGKSFKIGNSHFGSSLE